MDSTLFSEATPEQFKKFWEDNGFRVSDSCTFAARYIQNCSRLCITVEPNGFVCVGYTPLQFGPYTTFGEALEALNELAATRCMGGWAK